jgi:hypothetical protein
LAGFKAVKCWVENTPAVANSTSTRVFSLVITYLSSIG